MKSFYLLIILCLFSAAGFAQGGQQPVIDRARDRIERALGNRINTHSIVESVGSRVPDRYMRTHCFIQNTSTGDSYLSISKDRTIWGEKKLDPLSSNDIAVTDSIYLKMKTGSESFEFKAFPKHYYKIFFNDSSHRWEIK